MLKMRGVYIRLREVTASAMLLILYWGPTILLPVSISSSSLTARLISHWEEPWSLAQMPSCSRMESYHFQLPTLPHFQGLPLKWTHTIWFGAINTGRLLLGDPVENASLVLLKTEKDSHLSPPSPSTFFSLLTGIGDIRAVKPCLEPEPETSLGGKICE